MQTSDPPDDKTAFDQELGVRYIDSQGTYHEERLQLLNLAAFILNSIKQPNST